jgi:hypothetical protein
MIINLGVADVNVDVDADVHVDADVDVGCRSVRTSCSRYCDTTAAMAPFRPLRLTLAGGTVSSTQYTAVH